MISTEIAPYPILSSGVDWLSIRTKEFDVANAYDALAFEVFKAAKESGEKIENAVRVGFAGRAASGIFLGHKESTSLLTLSSEVARKYAPVALKLGGSVARIDLQVTIDTRRDKPNLASRSYFQAKVVPSKGGRPRELKLTQTHPAGDTLNVNKRTSDHYGRVYDFATAHQTGDKHSIWRYEVEFKRGVAKTIASTLDSSDDYQAVTESLVHQWYRERLPQIPFTPRRLLCAHNMVSERKERNVLSWFEDSLSVTVGRAIKDYGVERTLKALGLQRFLPSNSEEVN
jgi:hypothetical protein